MVDKPRKSKGPGSGGNRPARAHKKGGFGEGPRAARPVGKPGKGPARPRTIAGVDERSFEVLEREGLLTKEALGLRAVKRQQGGEEPKRPRTAKVYTRRSEPGYEPAARQGRAGTGKSGGGALDSPLGQPVEKPGRNKPGFAGPRGQKRLTPGPAPARRLDPTEALVAQRLHKLMAQAGVASRRHSEELIQAGRVTVNGTVVTELGAKAVPGKDRIEVDGRALGKPEDLVYIMLNKPKGYVTTMYDPQGRAKVLDLLTGEVAERVYPVGRLDFETEGLLLLTNDGDLANALMHPARKVKKTYIAKVRGVPGPAKLSALAEGIELEDGMTAPAEVQLIEVKGPNAATLSIRIHEGRNRQVRRMFEALGHEVIHLKRTTLGPLQVKELPVGQWRELTQSEVNELRLSAGLRTNREGTPKGPPRRGGAPAPTGPVSGPKPARKVIRPKGPRPDGDTGPGFPKPVAGRTGPGAAPSLRSPRVAGGSPTPSARRSGKPGLKASGSPRVRNSRPGK